MSPCKAPTSASSASCYSCHCLGRRLTSSRARSRTRSRRSAGTSSPCEAVGDSDIQGDVSLELSAERPVIADLHSKTLDLDDLGVLVGAPPGTGPGETASREQEQKAAQEAAAKAPVLPDKQFDVPELQRSMRISFTGDTVQAMKLPLEHMEARSRSKTAT